jgi:hypothetical protein
MTVLNADDLDLCAILWATVAYATANLDDLLPRSGEYPVDRLNVGSTYYIHYNVVCSIITTGIMLWTTVHTKYFDCC